MKSLSCTSICFVCSLIVIVLSIFWAIGIVIMRFGANVIIPSEFVKSGLLAGFSLLVSLAFVVAFIFYCYKKIFSN